VREVPAGLLGESVDEGSLSLPVFYDLDAGVQTTARCRLGLCAVAGEVGVRGDAGAVAGHGLVVAGLVLSGRPGPDRGFHHAQPPVAVAVVPVDDLRKIDGAQHCGEPAHLGR